MVDKYKEKSVSKQAGISLTEAILGVATLGVGLGIIADLQVENLQKVKSETAAQQMQIVFDAAQAAVRDYYTNIIAGCPAMTCVSVAIPATAVGATSVLPLELLTEENYLDPRMVDGGAIRLNSFGQSYVISVTNLGAPPSGGGQRLRVQVVTQGGQEIDEVNGANIAAAIGNSGGFRPPDGGGALYADDTMYGSYGNWQLSQADMGGAATAPSDGGLAAVAYFGEGGVTADFLYRNPVPGQPEAQQMNANIDNNQFGLGNLRQIGGGTGVNGGGTAPAGNPDVVNSGTRPEEIVAAFGADPVDTANAPDAVDTVRFGNVQASRTIGGAPGAYDRGNVNIQANNVLVGSVDAEYRLRSLERLGAVDRANLNGRRTIVDSGLVDDGAGDVIDAGAAALGVGSVSTDPGFKFYDDAGTERGIFTHNTLTDGQFAMGDDTGLVAGRRAEITYGLDAAAAADPDAGNFVMRDDTQEIRAANRYTNNDTGFYELSDGGPTAAAGDNVRRFVSDYGRDAAGVAAVTAGNLAMADDGARERVRFDYGLNAAGATAPAAGNFQMSDNATEPRLAARYINGTTGFIEMSDTGGAPVGDSVRRYVTDYGRNGAGGNAANAGNQVLFDNGGGERVRLDYGSDDTGATSGNAGNLVMRDNSGDARFDQRYNGNVGAYIANDNGSNPRYTMNYNNTDGNVFLQDQGGNTRFADEYAAAASASTMSDNANRVRFRSEVTNANNSFYVMRDSGGQDRIEHRINGATTQSFLRDNGGGDRIVGFADGGDTRSDVRDSANQLRYRFQTANGLQRLYGTDGVERVRINSTSGDANFAPTNSANANNGGIQLRAADGGIEIASQNNDGAYIDFKGSSNLGADYRGRILYDNAGNRMDFHTQGASEAQLRILNGRAILKGNGGSSGGKIVLSHNNTMPNDETAESWTIDAQNNNNFRIFNGTGGTATQGLRIREVSSEARAIIGNNGAFNASPLGADRSVLDVDDIFLRGRNTWLSNALQVHVIGSQVLRVGGASFNNGAAAPCPGGNRLYVATPAWWLSPTMIGVTDINTTDGGRVSNFGTINPATGSRFPASGTGFDNNTEVQVFMTGGGALNMRARQRNDSGWRTVNGGVAVVTAYCEPS